MKEEIHQLMTSTQNLQDKAIQLEDVLVQVTEFLKSLNDKVEAGGGGSPAAPPMGWGFACWTKQAKYLPRPTRDRRLGIARIQNREKRAKNKVRSKQ
jgi:hypothetical protein